MHSLSSRKLKSRSHSEKSAHKHPTPYSLRMASTNNRYNIWRILKWTVWHLFGAFGNFATSEGSFGACKQLKKEAVHQRSLSRYKAVLRIQKQENQFLKIWASKDIHSIVLFYHFSLLKDCYRAGMGHGWAFEWSNELTLHFQIFIFINNVIKELGVDKKIDVVILKKIYIVVVLSC